MPTTKNVIITGWKGTLGKEVVFRQRDGKTIASAYPDMSKRVLSPKQLKINELMKKANLHVQTVMADEQSRNEAQVRLDVPRSKLYTALIREYYKNNYKPETSNDVANGRDNSTVNASVHDPVTYDFIRYLLENTVKSIEEISRLTKAPVDYVSCLQDSYRKHKEKEDLVDAFHASRENNNG